MGQDCDIAPWVASFCSSAPEATFNASDLVGGFGAIANRIYLHAKLLQVALTEDLLGETSNVLRFSNMNRLHVAHVRRAQKHLYSTEGGPSTWSVCGSAIPIVQTVHGGTGTFLPRLVHKGISFVLD